MQQFRLTVTSEGQVTLPAEFRTRFGIEAGTQLTLVLDDAGGIRLRKDRGLLELAGSMAHVGREIGRPITEADIAEACAIAVGDKEDRSRG